MKLSKRVRPDVEAAPWVINEIAALEAERDALRADAERYRWVRDEWYIKGHNLPWRDVEWEGDNPANLDEYDAAIDAAREAT